MALTLGRAAIDLTLNRSPFNAAAPGALGAIKGFALKAAGALAAIAATVGVVRTAMEGIRQAADFEQTSVAMATLLGSMEKARALLADITKFAAETPFEFPELASAAKMLLAFGTAQEEVVSELRMLGDIASGVNIPLGELAELYGKARVQGRLFAQDINQLTGRGIPIIGELAKMFGVAETEIRELVESGEVNFSHLQKALQNLTSEGGIFAGMMEEQSKTLAGRWSTFKDSLTLSLRQSAEAFMPLMKRVLELGILVSETVGPRIIGAFQSIAGAVTEFVEVMTFTFVNAGRMIDLWATSAALSVMTFALDLKHSLVQTVGAALVWLELNWRNIFTDIMRFTENALANLGDNLLNFFEAVKGWLNGEGFDFQWTGITEGFESSLTELPKIADRQLTKAERELQEHRKKLSLAIGKDAMRFFRPDSEGAEGGSSRSPTTDPLGGVAAAAAGGTSSRAGQFVALADAFKRLQEGILGEDHGRQTAKNTERTAQAAEKIVDQAAKTNDALNTVATNLVAAISRPGTFAR